MTNLEYIDNYYKGELSAAEIADFDQRVINDPGFAEEVFIYSSNLQLAKEKVDAERKERFGELYKAGRVSKETAKPRTVRKLWRYATAAAVIAGLVLAALVFLKPASLEKKADQYISQNLQVMSVQMAGSTDSLQVAKQLYNENKLAQSLQLLERLMLTDTTSGEMKNAAGIVSLRLGEYDKAIQHFSALEKISLFANPGKFNHALTLIKRDRPGDRQTAKSLLQQVVNENLDGKETAANWLKDF